MANGRSFSNVQLDSQYTFILFSKKLHTNKHNTACPEHVW